MFEKAKFLTGRESKHVCRHVQSMSGTSTYAPAVSLTPKGCSSLRHWSSKDACLSGGMLSGVILCVLRQAPAPAEPVTEWVQ